MESEGNVEMAASNGGGGMSASGGAGESIGLFPPSPRIIFGKSPLTQVVSQVRYPTILKIDRTPADFQERIRAQFPLYERASDFAVGQPEGAQIPPQIMQLIGGQIAGGSTPHRFITANRQTTVSLALDSLSLSTTEYTRWEDFFGLFKTILSALAELYVAPFFTRIGLRYINHIERIKISIPNDYSWSHLIRKEVLGELSIPDFENNVERALTQIRLTLPNGNGNVYFQHGMNIVPNKADSAYVLDFDISKQGQIEVHNAEYSLDQFHQLAGFAFRWCITDELRNRLDPTSPE